MRLNFISDPGHGWLVVERTQLIELGIIHKISSYSYQKDGLVYLEEDCDAGHYVEALKAKGIKYTVAEQSLNGDAPCRRFARFCLSAQEAKNLPASVRVPEPR